MNRLPSPPLVFGLGLLALAACGENDLPTQPPTEPTAAPVLATFAANSWTARAAYPLDTVPGVTAVGPGGQAGVVNNSAGQPIVYMIGDRDDEDCCEVPIGRYNVATNVWSFAPRQQPVGVLVYGTNGVANIGGKLFFSGGYDKGGSVVEITFRTTVYDPVANTLTERASLPKASADGISAVINDQLYVLPGTCSTEWVGSQYCDTESYRRLFRYNPATDHWVSKKLAPHYHKNGAGGAISGKFYVVGGEERYTRAPVTTLDVYDPATETWKTLAPVPVGGTMTGAVLRNKLFVLVSSSANGQVTNHVYAYDPTTNHWNAKASPKWGHAALVLVRLPDGPHLVAVGGAHFDASVDAYVSNDTELYTP